MKSKPCGESFIDCLSYDVSPAAGARENRVGDDDQRVTAFTAGNVIR
jgi:hypothetical protein